MRREEVLNRLREMKPALARDESVRAIAIFGSVARDEARDNSDIDIIVEFENTPDMFKFVALQDRLSDALGAKVDLFTARGLHPLLRDKILAETIYA
ncbi:MAG: nucleotidyltransferase family protein [Hyphomicrobium sp.]